MSFQEDLEKGQVNEQRLIKWLAQNGFDEFKTCEWSGYDVMASRDGRVYTFEVKTDFIDSKNIAVEFFCLRRLKHTGISSTQADYWVQFFAYGDGIMFKTSTLKKFIQEAHPKIVYGGDNKDAILFLIKKKDIPNYKAISFEAGNGFF